MGEGAGASAATAPPARKEAEITAARKIARALAPKAAITTKARSRSKVGDARAASESEQAAVGWRGKRER